MKIFIICTVRGASEEYKKELEDYVAELEGKGHKVHLPHRDTNQEATGIEICKENAGAIYDSHQVHIFYNELSQGTHFDMGVAFALGKRIKVIKNGEITMGKSFSRMLVEWQTNSDSSYPWAFFDFNPDVKNLKNLGNPDMPR
jgi:nucleoside 2-deoxyribosyltransferase